MIQTVLFSLFLLQINLLPIIFVPLFEISFEFPKFIIFLFLSSLMWFFMTLEIIKSKKILIPSSNLLFPLILLFLIYAISTISSISPFTSFFGLREVYTGGFIYFVLLLVNFYVAMYFVKKTKIIIKSIVITSVFVSLYGIGEYLFHFQNNQDIIFRISSTIGHPVRLAFYLISVVPLTILLYLIEKKLIYKIIYFLFLIIIILALALTFTKSTMIVFLLIIPLILHNIISLNKIKKNISLPLIIISFLSTIFFVFFLYNNIPKNYSNFIRSSIYLRLNEWINIVENFKHTNIKKLIMGTGSDTVYYTYQKNNYLNDKTIEQTFNAPLQVRNMFLNYLVTLGFAGLITYIFFIRQLFYKFKTKDVIIKFLYISLLAILLNSIFYYQTENVLLIFWIIAGLLANPTTVFIKKTIYLKPISKIVIFITFILMLYAFTSTIAEFINSTSNDPLKTRFIHLFNPFEPFYTNRISYDYYLKAKSNLSKNLFEAQINFDQAIVYAKKSVYLAPKSRQFQFNLANLYYWGGINLNKNYNYQAIPILEQLINTDPMNYYLIDQLGLVFLNIKNYESALHLFRQALIINPNHAGSYLHIGEIYKQKGDFDTAISQYQKALTIFPNWDFALKQIDEVVKLKNNKK